MTDTAFEPHKKKKLALSRSRYLKSQLSSPVSLVMYLGNLLPHSLTHPHTFIKHLLWLSIRLDATVAKETSISCTWGVQCPGWTSRHYTNNHTKKNRTKNINICSKLKEHVAPKELNIMGWPSLNWEPRKSMFEEVACICNLKNE